MLSTDNELAIHNLIADSIGGRAGRLMANFTLDAIKIYDSHIYWTDIKFAVPNEFVVTIKFFDIQDRETQIYREYDELTIKPAEGSAIVRLGDSNIELAIDDLVTEPYVMGDERPNSPRGRELEQMSYGVKQVLRDIRRTYSILDCVGWGNRVELARIPQGGH